MQRLTRRKLLEGTGLGVSAVVFGCESDGDDGDTAPYDTDVLPTSPSETGTPDPDTDTTDTTDTDTTDASCDQTPKDIEGPFYVPGVPVREELDLYGDVGPRLTLTGLVLDTACVPIVGAVVEIWHVAPDGAYDNTSPEMRYRGQTAAAADGSWRFHTLMPIYYGGRPLHVHLKVWRKGVEVLTTQIYFADDPEAAGQDPALIVPRMAVGADYTSSFDVVIPAV